jgi:hypothetical protein
VNLRLDEVLRRVVRDAPFRAEAEAAPERTAEQTGVSLADLEAVLSGDLTVLHARGAHPLLIMQLAGALGIEPMGRLGEAGLPSGRTGSGT